ncbi:acyl-CoA dehydrogenase family protein [Cryptosporangium japonicum]|uniref:Acyl-CoA dehydrogenase family protein n=1 Tax=Cryptosporangium japonicum TaxID=80872 RepID=A0ABP3EWJ4_9ACTN
MEFGPSAEQRALADAVDDLVTRRARGTDPRAVLDTPRGYDETLWRTLCDQIGAAGLAIGEEHGGAGYSPAETHVVLERLGARLVPSPLLGSAVLAAGAIAASGDDDACARLLPGLAAGTTVGALAWADTRGRWRGDGSDVRADRDGPGWTLRGTATLVLDGADADVAVVVADTGDGAGLFEAHGPIARQRTPALDPTLRFATWRFDGTPATALTLDAGPVLAALADRAAVAVTALQVGAAGECLRRTVEHLRTRVQFGRPLGSFQALKHRVADLFVAVESARSMSWAAAGADAAELPYRAALAKAWCSDAYEQVAAETVQLHGGIAITWEHDAHLYFKRAHATAQLFGTSREHRRRLLSYV